MTKDIFPLYKNDEKTTTSLSSSPSKKKSSNKMPKISRQELSTTVGLEDMVASGWFNSEKSELFPGFSISPQDVVLDFGCGAGNFLEYCCTFLPKRIIAIDVRADAVEATSKLLSRFDTIDVSAHLSTTVKQPFPDGVANRLICMEVLEHVDDVNEVLSELYRLGTPDALYLMTVPGQLAEQCQKLVAPAEYFEKPNHIRVFSLEEIQSSFEMAGFQIVSQLSWGYYWSIWWSLFWGTGSDWSDHSHPVLVNWARSWRRFLKTPGGLEAKKKLDDFMPKSRAFLLKKL